MKVTVEKKALLKMLGHIKDKLTYDDKSEDEKIEDAVVLIREYEEQIQQMTSKE